MRRVGWLLALPVGLYLIARAVVEPFMIDLSDPGTYRNDWGGPSLAGVLAVHMGPGLLAAGLLAAALVRRWRAARERAPDGRA